VLGAPHVHVVLGGVPERRLPVPIDEQIAECVRVSRAVEPLARDLGANLAFENHGDLLARELIALVEAAGPHFVGVCLDTGNPATMAEDPLMAVELLAPHTLTGHIRDSRVWAVPEGAMVQAVPMGHGSHDFVSAVAILREQAPSMCFDLETLGGAPRLLPYLDPTADFWSAFPTMPARDFARYHALAQRGRAEPYEMLLPPPSHPAGGAAPPPDDPRLIEQQRLHFEESVRYCRDALGLGERSKLKTY
jgi:3-oxoisoapionate decarboxylase